MKTNRYRVEPWGNGVSLKVIFDNWIGSLTTKIDELLVGLDFGYVNDPTALVCSILDEKERKKLFIFDEFFKKGL